MQADLEDGRTLRAQRAAALYAASVLAGRRIVHFLSRLLVIAVACGIGALAVRFASARAYASFRQNAERDFERMAALAREDNLECATSWHLGNHGLKWLEIGGERMVDPMIQAHGGRELAVSEEATFPGCAGLPPRDARRWERVVVSYTRFGTSWEDERVTSQELTGSAALCAQHASDAFEGHIPCARRGGAAIDL